MKNYYISFFVGTVAQSIIFYLLMNINQFSYEIEISLDNMLWHIPLSLTYGCIMTYVLMKDMIGKNTV